MTGEQAFGLMLVGLALILYGRRKKRRTPPARGEMVYFEMIEFIEVRSRAKAPMVVRNLAILVAILWFIWAVYRS